MSGPHEVTLLATARVNWRSIVRRLVIAAALSVAVISGLAGPLPAVAAEEPVLTGPVITQPEDGSRLDLWNGKFYIDFTDAPSSQYRITVSAYNGAQVANKGGFFDSTAGVQEFKYWSAVSHTDVTITVEAVDQPQAQDASTFHVIGAPGPRVTDFEDEATISGWDGFLTVDFTGAPVGEWRINRYSESLGADAALTTIYDGTTATAVQRIRIEHPTTDGYHSVNFVFDGVIYSRTTWTNAPVVQIDGLKVSSGSFYPTVRDGFRDNVKVAWELTMESTSTVRIRNSNGQTIRTFADRKVGRDAAGRHAVIWNGRTESGVKAPAGDYVVQVEARDANGGSNTAEVGVSVISDRVKDTTTLTRHGSRTSKRIRHGDCYYTNYSGQLSIDCWGFVNRASAEARYAFNLPRSATNLRYKISGQVGCCARGVFNRGLVRTSKTKAYAYVRLTGTRAFTVNRASLTYDYMRKR